MHPSHNAFCETTTWLRDCKKLRNLALFGYFEPAWIALILSEISIHLTSVQLDYQSFESQDNKIFFQSAREPNEFAKPLLGRRRERICGGGGVAVFLFFVKAKK